MKQLFEFINKRAPIEGQFGIEIETEGENLIEVDDQYWHSTRDGSLRGENYEYIFKNPLPFEKVLPALNALRIRLKGSQLDYSFRTSVHVHVNAQAMKHKQICSMVYAYYLLEEPLMTFCGKQRKGNRFCLRLQDAEGVLQHLSLLFKHGIASALRVDEDAIRYAALNLGSLKKYGSIEFRAMEGNLDVERLHIWVRALKALQEYAMSGVSPKDIYEAFQVHGAKAFLLAVLGDVSEYFIYPRMTRDMDQSASLSIDLPFTYVEERVEKAIEPGRKRVFAPPNPIGLRVREEFPNEDEPDDDEDGE